MTTVTAIQGEGWAVIACDTRITTENRISQMPSDLSKVSKNGKYLIAVAGNLKVIPLMAYTFRPTQPPVRATGSVLDRFITEVFVPELEVFMSQQFPKSAKDGEEEDTSAGGFLVLINGVVYEVGVGYTWSRDDSGKYAIGSGSEYALGILHTTITDDIVSAEKLSRYAIEIASTLDTNTNDTVQTFVQKASSKK